MVVVWWCVHVRHESNEYQKHNYHKQPTVYLIPDGWYRIGGASRRSILVVPYEYTAAAAASSLYKSIIKYEYNTRMGYEWYM